MADVAARSRARDVAFDARARLAVESLVPDRGMVGNDVGNAGGVEVALNGKVLPPLGPKGTVIQHLELPQAPASGS